MKNIKSLALTILVILAIGIGYKFVTKNNHSSSSSLIFEVGSTAKKGKDRFAKEIPLIEKNFKENGLNVSITQVLAGTNTLSDKVHWDFTMSTTMFVLMQRKNGLPVEPLAWSKGCTQNAIGISLLDNTDTISNMRDKKIIMYGFGYNTGTVLRAIKDWNLEKAQLFTTTDGANALQLLFNKEADMLISDAAFFQDNKDSNIVGTEYERNNLKIIASTNYSTPCRIVAYSGPRAEAGTKEKFLATLKNSKLELLANLTLIDKSEFDKLASEFDWAELDKINTQIKPLAL